MTLKKGQVFIIIMSTRHYPRNFFKQKEPCVWDNAFLLARHYINKIVCISCILNSRWLQCRCGELLKLCHNYLNRFQMLLPQDTSGVLRDVESTIDFPNIFEREAVPATSIVPFNMYLLHETVKFNGDFYIPLSKRICNNNSQLVMWKCMKFKAIRVAHPTQKKCSWSSTYD